MNRRSKILTGLGTMVLVGTTAAAGVATTTTASAHSRHRHHVAHLSAHLDPLNNSGAHGHATVDLHHSRAHVHIAAYGLAKGLAHAQHIHYGADARHECPSVFKNDDKNKDFRLNVAEGAPAYGAIVKSLTTKGDYSPDSALDLTRFPTTPHGTEHYNRTINFSAGAVRSAIRHGDGVIVIHGVDYNHNGMYDFAGAGASELDATGKTPAEATDPALCGALNVRR
jgi:hypothetical protein